jgi:hypothetical protein
MKDLAMFLKDHPHNTNCGDRFGLLFEMAYQCEEKGLSPEAFAQYCLDVFGGTLASALIDYLDSNR